ncbi:hypothetical protein HW511_14630 [Asaia siamensis]|uniref:DNA N-6-adenine-methyltransferase Dam n=1 Tax=Asaia siamensis TaxID=110479 RepID=A0ABQ1ML10_9PROT|nr:hypothetical protein [Asaia siamensis]GBR07123.1 hypothetical protein AA0323_1680 [Asaia siamensis NRIC 0323]GGC42036.1 hypothetical protein GCM10007207_29200 [Asaia siamensis]
MKLRFKHMSDVANRYRELATAIVKEGRRHAVDLKRKARTMSAAISVPRAANDNGPLAVHEEERLPQYRDSFVSVVKERRGEPRAILSLSQADARLIRIRPGDRVIVEAYFLTDPYFATSVWGFSIRRTTAGGPPGVVVETNGAGIRVRVRGVCPVPMDQRPIYLSPETYAPSLGGARLPIFLPWTGHQIAFPEIKTLALTRAGIARRLLLAGWRAPSEKGAGDECFTPAFVFQWGLKAAGKSQYDLDICTMNGVGDYRKLLQGVSHVKTEWGAVPEQYRDLEAALTPVPARHRFTSDGPFGSLTQPWDGELFWINPPYENRTWACFMERAHREVEKDGRKLFLTLGPDDNAGPQAAMLYDRYACKITLERQLSFFKVRSASVKAIKGSQLVVFGRGLKMRQFLWRLTGLLYEDGFISSEQRGNINRKYALGLI